ncbi:TetR/AcrR family transcriptional regulator [Allopusillimonas ginsengisoli]|uniref:TetR/AcrR family transcriptional regulator n=1 Tax=Allopusillimonas ginsengisoli TaxID=453575 RepID=UPI00101EFE4A|nr:TetR/AcrR family transcriptional regulator [Allopusillimonas ginsengisoli]TEA80147.1 TetR/AcrR family transcriptional regulator [Allopusillimonas ginsengisoli]
MTTKSIRPRGRPRKFNIDEAIATAQSLFHSRGYESVSVSDVTDALGINTPSFYSAFRSKAGLFERVINRYADHGAIPLADILRPDRPAAECIAAMLEEAARHYATDPAATGCIVLEGCRSSDEEARVLARAAHKAAIEVIRRYIAARHPSDAAQITEYVSTLMIGLSAQARAGTGLDTLLGTVRVASLAVASALRA